MSYNNKIITKPVSIADVQNALGLSANDVGTLCTSANINKFAKWKPFSSQGQSLNGLVSPQDSKDVRQNHRYGLTVYDTGLSVDGSDAKTAQDFGEALWGDVVRKGAPFQDGIFYSRPKGNIGSPYRLTDFVNCDNAAQGYSQTAYLHNYLPEVGSIYLNFPTERVEEFSFPTEDQDLTTNPNDEGESSSDVWNNYFAKGESGILALEDKYMPNDVCLLSLLALCGAVDADETLYNRGIAFFYASSDDSETVKAWVFINTIPWDSDVNREGSQMKDMNDTLALSTAEEPVTLHFCEFLTPSSTVEGLLSNHVFTIIPDAVGKIKVTGIQNTPTQDPVAVIDGAIYAPAPADNNRHAVEFSFSITFDKSHNDISKWMVGVELSGYVSQSYTLSSLKKEQGLTYFGQYILSDEEYANISGKSITLTVTATENTTHKTSTYSTTETVS